MNGARAQSTQAGREIATSAPKTWKLRSTPHSESIGPRYAVITGSAADTNMFRSRIRTSTGRSTNYGGNIAFIDSQGLHARRQSPGVYSQQVGSATLA